MTTPNLQLLTTFPRKHRNLLLCIAAVAGAGYGGYRFYNSSSYSRLSRIFKSAILFADAVSSSSQAISSSAETINLISSDLNEFLRSESDEIPNSLKQAMKVIQSDDFHRAMSRVSSAFVSGIHGSFSQQEDAAAPAAAAPSVLETLFSPAGTGFASAVVGAFARNLVQGFLDTGNSDITQKNPQKISPESPDPQKSSLFLVAALCQNAEAKRLIAESIQNFVSTAVTVYLDKTMDINTFDLMFSSLSNPSYHAEMKGILVSVFNGAVETLIRTSHEVLSGSGSPSSSAPTSPPHYSSHAAKNSKSLEIQEIGEAQNMVAPIKETAPLTMTVPNGTGSREENCIHEHQRNGMHEHQQQQLGQQSVSDVWVDKISHTLAIPSNRKLFLDVSGKMAFEIVRSFCEFVVSKISSFCLRTVPTMSYEVIETVVEFIRSLQARAVVIATICFAICLQVLYGSRILQPL